MLLKSISKASWSSGSGDLVLISYFTSFSCFLCLLTEEKEKNALMEQKLKEEEEKCFESERMMQAEKERQKDQMRQMQEKFSKELEQQQQETDRAIESKLKEQEEMIKKGFSEKADLLNEEIATLKKEKESSGGFMKEYVMPVLGAVAEILPTFLKYKVMMKGLKKVK